MIRIKPPGHKCIKPPQTNINNEIFFCYDLTTNFHFTKYVKRYVRLCTVQQKILFELSYSIFKVMFLHIHAANTYI